MARDQTNEIIYLAPFHPLLVNRWCYAKRVLVGSIKRTLAEGRALMSFDLTRCGGSDIFGVLLDDSIRSVKNLRRNREVDLLRGLEIDHQLELHRLLYG